LIGKSEEKISRGRPRPRWKENIKMDLREAELKGLDWIYLGQGRNGWRSHVNAVMNLLVP
jgi:hypothetical protein